MDQLLALSVGGQQLQGPANLPPPDSGPTIISNALQLFISAGIIIVVFMLIWAGIQWSSSAGDKQKLASARGRLTWAIIGLIIILLSFGIIGAISYFFNVPLLNLNFSTQ